MSSEVNFQFGHSTSAVRIASSLLIVAAGFIVLEVRSSWLEAQVL
jgi:hypothetical protein